MIVRRSKWMMMLLTCAVSVAWVAAEPAQTAPSPPPPPGGQEAPQGSEVRWAPQRALRALKALEEGRLFHTVEMAVSH